MPKSHPQWNGLHHAHRIQYSPIAFSQMQFHSSSTSIISSLARRFITIRHTNSFSTTLRTTTPLSNHLVQVQSTYHIERANTEVLQVSSMSIQRSPPVEIYPPKVADFGILNENKRLFPASYSKSLTSLWIRLRHRFPHTAQDWTIIAETKIAPTCQGSTPPVRQPTPEIFDEIIVLPGPPPIRLHSALAPILPVPSPTNS